jgi:2-polyprenyl-6-hydroxyphenyl methylase/3-demethylubiquinone-9 3-methyltransferase
VGAVITEFFGVLGPYVPPPEPRGLPAGLWGNEDHVRELFGDRVEVLEMTRRHYVERAATPHAYRELYKRTFGPVVAIYASVAARPDVAAALDHDFLEFAIRANTGPAGRAAEYRYEYLLIVARRRS